MPITLKEIYEQLARLHLARTWAYRDSWRRDGEVDPVTNILRKTDRLAGVLAHGIENAFIQEKKETKKIATPIVRKIVSAGLRYLDLPEPSNKTEGVFDTIADTGVYATKYLTFLAWKYPTHFESYFEVPSAQPHQFKDHPDNWSAKEIGTCFNSTVQILVHWHQTQHPKITKLHNAKTLETCLNIIETYEPLVRMIKRGELLENPDPQKFAMGAHMSLAACQALVHIAQDYPEIWKAYMLFIDSEWNGLKKEQQNIFSLTSDI